MNTDKILVLLRVALGGLFFYAGITKILNPVWSPAGYLENAQTFSSFYTWLAGANNLPWVTLLNEWGLTLIGLSLILGVGIKLFGRLGVLLMILYYLPILNFPYVGDHSVLIDEHIIYILVLCLLVNDRASRKYSFDQFFRNSLPSSLSMVYKKIS